MNGIGNSIRPRGKKLTKSTRDLEFFHTKDGKGQEKFKEIHKGPVQDWYNKLSLGSYAQGR
jgi:hypothetical protein